MSRKRGLIALLWLSGHALAYDFYDDPAEKERERALPPRDAADLAAEREAVKSVRSEVARARSEYGVGFHSGFIGKFTYQGLDVSVGDKVQHSLMIDTGSSPDCVTAIKKSPAVKNHTITGGSCTTQVVGFQGRQFLGNSFNWTAGFGARSYRYKVDIIDGENRRQGSVTVGFVELTAGISNIWILENRIILGVDWLSLHQPTIVGASDSQSLKGSATSDTIEDAIAVLREQTRAFANRPTWAFGTVQVGYTF